MEARLGESQVLGGGMMVGWKSDLRVYPIKVVLERKMVVGDDRSYRTGTR